MINRMIFRVAAVFLFTVSTTTALAEDEPAAAPMTGERMTRLIERLDSDARAQGNVVEFEVDRMPIVLVFDEAADRMRLMSPIIKVDELKDGQLTRLMQANFDSALDARYAIANGMVWSVFVHPLGSLSEEHLVLGIGQTLNVVSTFGSSYSSGVFVFGGGDSSELEQRKLIDRLREFLST